MTATSNLILRLSLFLLFLWFGVQQLLDPGAWTGFLPEWTGYLPIPDEMLVSFNGWFEVVFSFMLLAGFGTRFASALLGLHLVGIAFTAGGAIAARDLALAGCCFALAFAHAGKWSLDGWLKQES